MLTFNINFLKKPFTKVISICGFCVFYFIAPIYSQEKDSLISLLENDILDDSTRMEVLYLLVKERSIPIDSTLIFIEKLESIANRIDHPSWEYRVYFRYGHAFKKLGEHEKSLDYYLKSLKLANKMNNVGRQAVSLGSIAALYKVADQNEMALAYFNKSINLLRAKKDVKNLAIGLTNAGELYRIIGQYDSALLFYNEAAILFDSINFTVGSAYSLGNLGILFTETQEFKKASANLNEAISMLSKLGDYYPITVYQMSLSDIALHEGDTTKALKLLDSSLNLSQKTGLKGQIRDANLKLSQLYDAINDYQKAFYYQSQYLVYRDSINNEEKIREIADLRTEYEVSQREIEIDLLKTQQRNQYIIFAAMAVIILLLITASFLYYRNSRRKQTLNLILKQRKEEAEAQRDQLEAINDTREKFLSIISHDLMGPVNSFKGLSTIMKMSIDNQNQKDLQDIHAVFDKSVNNLSGLLSNLLDWSVTQRGNIPYHPEKIELKALIEELFDLFFNIAEYKKIRLRSDISDSIHLWADVNSVNTILRNLVSNALKFTDNEGEIQLIAEKASPFIMIKVKDSGLGMPQSKIDLILSKDNFERSQGTQGERGLGLGLQLVKEFVNMNKGKLAIESKIDEGTTFMIYLPDYNQAP